MASPRAVKESGVQLYHRSFPVTFANAAGCEVLDQSGRRWIDFFCGAGALNYGHNHPRLVEAVVMHLREGRIVHALDVDTPVKQAFIDRLGQFLGLSGLDYRVQFCGPTGADAVEAALKLARKVTGRPGVIAFSGSFHGMTRGAASVSSSRQVRELAAGGCADTTFVPYAVGPNGPCDVLDQVAARLADDMSGLSPPGAIIVEALQFEGGLYAAPAAWLRRLREIASQHGIVLILDEIQSGCGRAGSFFAFERAGIVPDIVTLSKSLSGLGLPLSVCLIAPALDAWAPGDHTGTFRANQLALASATTALTLWEEPELAGSLAEGGAQLAAFAEELATGGDVTARIRGMALGLEGSEPAWAPAVQREAFKRGLLVETCGRDGRVLKACPPLTATSDELAEGLELLASAIAHASSQELAPAG